MPGVKIGVTLKMYDYRTYAPKSVADIARQARDAEALGYDSVWVMDHLLIRRGERRVTAHDPTLVLGVVAAATHRVTLGTLVLCHAFRHAGQLAREASALADASGGRFVLGLGAGWHRPEFDALGLPFDHRVGRLEEAVDPVRRLLRGERVSVDGRWLKLHEASVPVTSPAPPVWVAADGPRMLALAATAEGWTHANWGAADTTAFSGAAATYAKELGRLGRKRSDVETSAAIACVPGGWEQVPGGFSEPEVETGGVERLAEVVDAYAEAGADHVILSLSPDPFAELDPRLLETGARVRELL
ncbi:MAG TPA: LLM class flavin-dependent oxidoreductase [Candidatus Dormibacteraeota bacterium]|nr:LLM class flavin-dependent oxidoreductase [Candidatus Dormibacteraeota bacterium]